jgi:hypothetical protein
MVEMLSCGMVMEGYNLIGEDDEDRVIVWPCNTFLASIGREFVQEVRRFVPNFEITRTIYGKGTSRESVPGLIQPIFSKFFYGFGDSKEHEFDSATHCLVYFFGSKRLRKVPVMDVLCNFSRVM